MKNEEALNDVRRKVAEKLNKDEKKLVFGWRGEAEPKRQEGDIWTDSDGSRWEMKNGIKTRITKLESAKTPWWCPKCSKPMNHRYDIKFWRIRGHCMDCNIKEEMKIRQQGPDAWRKYEQSVMLKNYIAEVQDKIAELQEYHDTVSKPEFVNADETKILMMERWDVDLDKIKSDIRADIEQLQQWLKETIEKYGTGDDDETKNEETSRKDEVSS